MQSCMHTDTVEGCSLNQKQTLALKLMTVQRCDLASILLLSKRLFFGLTKQRAMPILSQGYLYLPLLNLTPSGQPHAPPPSSAFPTATYNSRDRQ